MSILCAIGGHEAAEGETYNSGYYFSACRRCRRDMIRSGAVWREVPRGHKVVWKGGCHSHSMEPDYGPALPALHRAANLPAVRTPFSSWGRQLVEIGDSATTRTNGVKARAGLTEEEGDERTYPYLIALAAVVGAGLQLVLSLREVRGSF